MSAEEKRRQGMKEGRERKGEDGKRTKNKEIERLSEGRGSGKMLGERQRIENRSLFFFFFSSALTFEHLHRGPLFLFLFPP